MGSKGSSRHKKRLSAPTVYPIKRKHGKFSVRPHPTRFKMEMSLPLGIVMREILGYAKTLSEAKRILINKEVKVDGKVQTSYKFAIGPMDILEIPKTEQYFRLTPYRGRRRVLLHPITQEEAQRKILRIKKKQTIKGGIFQLTFHDGRNLRIHPEEEQKIPVTELSVKDSVLLNLEEKIIEDHYPFTVGNIALIMGGHNIGIQGKIRDIETQTGQKTRTITLETKEGEIKTVDTHIFIIGRDKPVIEIPIGPVEEAPKEPVKKTPEEPEEETPEEEGDTTDES
ncbi:MAG: 30S ribosomal protein S4e [Candidatus Heimdallarchaeota archaeon]|nr:MAG: 30S ribosomal protein S4e [Candidatus Heimdallarchaeota archaeon]